MSKIIKDSRGKFMKGVCTNPTGRLKGTMNETSKKFAHIRGLAAQDYEKAYKLLWEAVEAKESWAHQLFFKELVPKKLKEDTIIIENTSDSVESQIEGITRALGQMNELTHDESLNRLKTLANVKFNDSMDNQTDEIRITRDKLMGKVDIIEEMIEMKKKGEQHEK